MRKLVLAFVVLTVGAVSHIVWASGVETDSVTADGNNVPVRPGNPEKGVPFWNASSVPFMHPLWEFKECGKITMLETGPYTNQMEKP